MSRRVKAKLVAPAACEWLATSRQARILHLFDHACNLVNEQGQVLSLVSEQIGAGPFHIVLEDGFVTGDLSPFVGDESPTTNVGEWLVELVDMRGAAQWQPRVDWDRLRAHTAVWQPHIPLMHTMVQRYRGELGLDTAVWHLPLAAGLQNVLTGIANKDTAVIQTGAAQLAGLGPGLTPAGDDLLLGVMVGLWATKPAEEVRPLGDVMVNTAVSRTTTLAAAWLRAAGRGEAGEVWHELGNRLSINGDRWQETVVRILGTGHSSGADALWGFTATVSLF